MKVLHENIPTEDLWQLLDDLEESVPTQRVLAAIATKQGDSTSRLTDRHNVSQQTIRNWLSRFENRPLEDAPVDDSWAGRPRKLSEVEHDRLMAELRESPEPIGFDRQAWFPRLVYHHLQSVYGVEYSLQYSLRHIRRLMREVGSTWMTARPAHYEGDPKQAAEFQDTVKKKKTASTSSRAAGCCWRSNSTPSRSRPYVGVAGTGSARNRPSRSRPRPTGGPSSARLPRRAELLLLDRREPDR